MVCRNNAETTVLNFLKDLLYELADFTDRYVRGILIGGIAILILTLLGF